MAVFNSWDVCDQVCDNLFQHTSFAYPKAFEWSGRSEEFVKRAGFVLMACLAFYDRTAPEAKLAQFFPVIVQASDDDRNFVKKAVNWALRNLGKRSPALNEQAIATAREIQARGTRAARWIAADALRELTSDKMKAAGEKTGATGRDAKFCVSTIYPTSIKLPAFSWVT